MQQWNRFWRWWMSELASLIPKADARIIAHRRLPLEIHIGEEGAALYLHQSLRTPLSADNRIAVAPNLSQLFSVKRRKSKAVLSFDDKLALQKSMPLSRLLYTNADAIIAGEVARTTPFLPGQTVNLWREAEPGRIEHAVLRRADVREAEELALANGIQIEAVAFRPRQQQSWPQLRGPNGSLWQFAKDKRWRIIAIGSLFAAMLFSCAYILARNAEHSSAYDAVTARIEVVRPKALERRKEIDAIAERISAFSALAKTHKAQSQLVATWVTLARILPDDTWLQALTLRDGKVQVEGNARNAEILISRVENSQSFKNAKFIAPVIDQQNAGSRFVMSFEIDGAP
jgi:general secretion pathway protein L